MPSRQKHKKLIFTLIGFILFFCLVPLRIYAAIPTLGTISPASGSTPPDLAKTFTCTYSDTDGWANLKEAYFLISTSSTALSNSAYLYYDQNLNKLYLRNDANTGWLGGYAPGSANSIENSYVKLNCALTKATGSTSTLTLAYNLTFKPAYSGKAYNTYLKVVDDTLSTAGWTKKGTYTVNNPPAVGIISPSSAAGYANVSQNFISTYTDTDGWQNIQYVYFLINTSTSGASCFYGYYNQNTNKLYLRNDANTSWLGGYAPGSANTIENSYVTLSCASTTISGLSNTLTVNWSIMPKSTFTGSKNMYLYVRDDANSYVNLTLKGTWTIQSDITPPTGNIAINNGNPHTNSSAVTLALSATDTESGMGTGSQMQFSNDGITWSTPESYALSKAWTLTTGEGQKTVYVKYKDAAGNWSTAFSSSIILDNTPPVISLNPISSPTNQDVSFSYTLTDNFTPLNEITITGDNSPYTSEVTHNVTLTAQDKAGNSASVSLSFTIDKTPPVVVITSPQNGQVIEDTTVTLQGTVDGVAFSETRTLTPGDNLLTKTVTDTAGNSASVSISVYVYLGQLIGPEGGEVLSSDGRVKIIIPQGALTTAQQIKIIKLSSTTIQNNVPLNTSLLSAVECKPYGLVFLKSVQIIYTLSQAEIPGTPVELGLYDSIQNKIISTGQTSTVPQDGYSLNFSISHFSTYAALKNLIAQSTPIGAYVKIPLPDLLTGSFSHAIPISVPPGRKGMQPALGLSYRSSNPNSWTGLGFSLNSGYIVRSTRLGPPTYNDTTDTFYLITDSGTTELVHLIDNLYQAKIESAFSKFYKESDDTWRVLAKDGSSLEFGKEASAKETSPKGTFSWYLTKAKDTNGNYLSYGYTKDQGKSYLSRIDYTGNDNGIAPANSVEFILEPRNDIPSSYISTAKVVTGLRLKEIQVKVNLSLVWRYVLEYTYSPDTNRSLLTSVKQLASDGKMLPEQKLTYQQAK